MNTSHLHSSLNFFPMQLIFDKNHHYGVQIFFFLQKSVCISVILKLYNGSCFDAIKVFFVFFFDVFYLKNILGVFVGIILADINLQINISACGSFSFCWNIKKPAFNSIKKHYHFDIFFIKTLKISIGKSF